MSLRDRFAAFFADQDKDIPRGLEDRSFSRTLGDAAGRLSPKDIKEDDFTTALEAANAGNPSLMARINDQMFGIDPEIRAGVKQLKGAISGVKWEPTAADESDQADVLVSEIKAAMKAPNVSMRLLFDWITEQALRGGGLIENVWNDPGQKARRVERHVVVPQARFRYNRATGAPQFAANRYAQQGLDVQDPANFPLGKWIVVMVDEHVDDWSLRGACPSLQREYFGRLNNFGYWLSAVERMGAPIVVGKANSGNDMSVMKEAFSNFFANWSIAVSKDSEVDVKEGISMRGGMTVWSEFHLKSAQRIFLTLLGESQTGIIEKGAGSTASADTQHQAARYVIEDFWALIAHVIRRDYWMPLIAVNHGREVAEELTPYMTPDLSIAADLKKLNDGVKGTLELGIEVGENWYRGQAKVPPPEDKEKRLTMAAIVAPAAGTPAAVPDAPPSEDPAQDPIPAEQRKAA